MATNTTSIDYPRGSEWRKWDLHLHTSCSYDYQYRGDDADELLVESLKSNNVSAVCITDHFVIDHAKIEKLRCLAPEIVFFPGVELRTDKGDTNIHIILIFDVLFNLNILSEDFNVFKRQKGKSIDNDERIYWDFNDIIKFAKDHQALITVHAGRKTNGVDDRITNSLDHNQAVKEEYASDIDIFEMGNIRDLEDYHKKVFPSIGIKPMIICSDNHDPRNYTPSQSLWIKADPTFEGLKQILYEPLERIRIQEDNPELEHEKSPFTSITIPQKTKVFNDEDDIFFDANSIPLNNGLVSIIGGRGTGKSQLINYLAAVFSKIKQANDYNLDSNIEISRKVSLTEDAKVFSPNDSPSASFMFIEQSQIKNLVADRDEFSKNILETIGVTDTYEISKEYSVEADLLVNEYYRIKKVLFLDGKTVSERKESINREIKRYEDFIQNITSEQNKKKLENYKGSVERLHRNKNWQQQVKSQYEKQKQFVTESNAVLRSWNEQLKLKDLQIPLIDISNTQDYLEQVLLPNILDSEKEITEEINRTKDEFKDYKGDLSTLLTRVSTFQEKLNTLKAEKASVEKEEQNYNKLSSESFKNLGAKIRESIQDYTTLIGEKWREFKGENLEDNSEKKRLLNLILQNGLEVEAAISFDVNKMYELLLDKLDRRKYNIDKLQDLLKIKNLEDFFSFVKLDSNVNVFLSDNIKEELRNQVLYHCYKSYTDFISIGVNVTLDKKSITKLSYGQQGTIYLRLQIAANMFSDTIIYDQPEDDLDNDFITQELISIFKTIKSYRQVIIVSHNANLVVNADSEQIIIAHNTDGTLSYTSGSLENPIINAEVCRILEGGKRAFEDRKRKYMISHNDYETHIRI